MQKAKIKHQRRNLRRTLLTLLLGGLALGLNRSPRRGVQIIGEMADELRGIRRANLKRTVKLLCGKGLLKEVKQLDGTISVILDEKGRSEVRRFQLQELKLKRPKKWDGYWRVVIFDVPEEFKKIRNVLRSHFKRLGLLEYQKSVFVYPFKCAEEIDQIVSVLYARKFVRQIIATSLDDEDRLIKHFDLE
ncbi:MAG: hypothetical protein HYV68_03525 [Candidatus Taylorbacteria bacterium]|nr:hypothetical protein [Candidatus Taylorbacteria bacterium]